MEILSIYIRKLKVDEIHIWDYTRTKEDEDWLYKEWKDCIFTVKDKTTFSEYYDYYNRERYPEEDTVLVKCDDDIVYIDVENFDQFIKKRIEFNHAFIVSPLVINQPTSSVLLYKNGLLNLQDPYIEMFSREFAQLIHKKFINGEIKKPSGFIEYSTEGHTFNINFIAILSRDFDVFQHKLFKENDEVAICSLVETFGWKIISDLDFIVSHMAYTAQRDDGFEESELLEIYSNIARAH